MKTATRWQHQAERLGECQGSPPPRVTATSDQAACSALDSCRVPLGCDGVSAQHSLRRSL